MFLLAFNLAFYSEISSGILSDRSSGIYSGISSGILSGNFFWHFLNIPWHIILHSIWHILGQIFWHYLLEFYLAFYVAFYLAYLLACIFWHSFLTFLSSENSLSHIFLHEVQERTLGLDTRGLGPTNWAWIVVVEVRHGPLGVACRGWGSAGNTGRGWSWLGSGREHCGSRGGSWTRTTRTRSMTRRRTRRKRRRRGGGGGRGRRRQLTLNLTTLTWQLGEKRIRMGSQFDNNFAVFWKKGCYHKYSKIILITKFR